MRRLLLIFAAFLFLTGATQAKKYDPPLTGDMVSLETYDDAKPIPEALLSSIPEGLSYLSQSKGQVVVLNIWATWCPPCIKELPSLNALQLAMGNDDFKVIAISLDHDKPDAVKKFMDDNNLKALKPYIDANGDINRLDVLKDVPAIPVTLILDRQMRVVARLQGPADWNGRSVRAVIEYYIKNLPPLASPD